MIRDLIEKRAAANGRIQELAKRVATENRDFTADERSSFDAASKEFDSLGERIKIERRRAEVEKQSADILNDSDVGREDGKGGNRSKRRNVQTTNDQQESVFRAWAKGGRNLTRHERSACAAVNFNPSAKRLNVSLGWPDNRRSLVKAEYRGANLGGRAAIMSRELRAAMSAQLGASGGYFVAPATLTSSYEMNLLAFGGVRQVAEEMTTGSGEPWVWPIADDTANVGELMGESAQAIGSGTNANLSRKTFYAYKFSSKSILVPTELLEDSSYDLAGMIGEALGIRLGRITSRYYATGTGASQPEGIVTGASLGITTASGTAITVNELTKLVHSIDPAYRSMPGVGWLMHDTIVSYLRQLLDSTGRPLLLNTNVYDGGSLDATAPARLLNYPLNICQELEPANSSTLVPVTAKKHVLFGVLSKYKIRKVRGVRIYRLEERYRDQDQTAFIVFIREDGKLIDAGTAPVKYLLQA